MPKPKQKKHQKKQFSKRKVVLIIASIIMVLIAGWIVVKVVEGNIAKQEEEKLFDRSFAATQAIYDQFYDKVSAPKQKTLPLRGICSSSGKYSTLYTCGPKARISVTDLNEQQYRDLNKVAIDIYIESNTFSEVGSKEPYETGLDPGLTGIATSRLKDSDMECYYISNYNPEKKTATFAWGCKRSTYNKYYSTAY